MLKKMLNKALSDLNKAINLEPNSIPFLLSLAGISWVKDDKNKANDYLTQTSILQNYSKNGDWLLFRAFLYRQLGNLEQALTDLDTLFAVQYLKPSVHTVALLDRAKIFITIGLFQHASKDINEASRNNAVFAADLNLMPKVISQNYSELLSWKESVEKFAAFVKDIIVLIISTSTGVSEHAYKAKNIPIPADLDIDNELYSLQLIVKDWRSIFKSVFNDPRADTLPNTKAKVYICHSDKLNRKLSLVILGGNVFIIDFVNEKQYHWMETNRAIFKDGWGGNLLFFPTSKLGVYVTELSREVLENYLGDLSIEIANNLITMQQSNWIETMLILQKDFEQSQHAIESKPKG